MRILGIDPGLATVGLGLVEAEGQKVRALEWLTIATEAGDPLPDRLSEIAKDVEAYLRESQPELVVIEKLFFSTNVKTALDVAHARGVILATVAAKGIRILEPTPGELKSGITGDGGADKAQMGRMLMTIFHLEQPPTPDDAADALALALFGVYQGKMMTIA